MNEKFYELSEEKRLRIINAGFEVFSRNTYKKASTDDIAAKAGISKGLLFYYFHDKKSLYLFLFDYAKQLMEQQVVDAGFLEITDIFELLEYAARKKYGILLKSPHIMDFLMRVMQDQQEGVSEDLNRKWLGASDEVFVKYFTRMDFSKFREDVNWQELLQMLFWTAEGYIYDIHRRGASLTLDDLMEKFRRWTDLYRKLAYKEEYLK
jgi:TetR/AcrR family transcriptional regulator